jgi:glycosyltransferase involved in cell wall biosynthesis
MPMNHSVGIIVPTYNKANFIQETLASLLNQTYKNLEVLVVDDGSTDMTSELCNAFNHDLRFSYMKNKENCGESFSVNAGWSRLKSRYIAIVSADDPQHPDWLESMVDFAAMNPGYVTYYPNLMIIDDTSTQIEIIDLPVWEIDLVQERLNCVASAGSIHDKSLFPINFLPRDPNVTYPSDLIQYLNFSLYGEGIKSPEVLGVWRKSQSGLTNVLTGHFKAQELTKAVTNWYSEHNETRMKINFRRMESNLVGQAWRLCRSQSSFVDTSRMMLEFFGFGWFCRLGNVLSLIREVKVWRSSREHENLKRSPISSYFPSL